MFDSQGNMLIEQNNETTDSFQRDSCYLRVDSEVNAFEQKLGHDHDDDSNDTLEKKKEYGKDQPTQTG